MKKWQLLAGVWYTYPIKTESSHTGPQLLEGGCNVLKVIHSRRAQVNRMLVTIGHSAWTGNLKSLEACNPNYANLKSHWHVFFCDIGRQSINPGHSTTKPTHVYVHLWKFMNCIYLFAFNKSMYARKQRLLVFHLGSRDTFHPPPLSPSRNWWSRRGVPSEFVIWMMAHHLSRFLF